MFLGELASDDQATATIDRTAAVRIPHVAAIFGAPTADASAWDSSRSGGNKSPVEKFTRNSISRLISFWVLITFVKIKQTCSDSLKATVTLTAQLCFIYYMI